LLTLNTHMHAVPPKRRQSPKGHDETDTNDSLDIFEVVDRVEKWRCTKDVIYRFMTTDDTAVCLVLFVY
jgi:hypothetical protein